MHLIGEISVVLEASDFVDAAEHQRWLETVFETVRSRYPEASYTFRPRRGPSPRPARRTVAPVRRATGQLNSYLPDDD